MAKESETAKTEDATNEVVDYTPKHVGGGTFEVGGKKIKGKAKAEEYAVNLRRADEQLAVPDLSDIVPDNWAQIRDRTLKFRNNLRELPMNETHLPNGSLNPMYDRTYRYVWGAYSAKQDVPDKQSQGYELVSRKDLEKMVKDNKCPDHYLNLLREEGRYLVYADDVLMRFPRVLDKQRTAALEARAQAHMKRVEQQGKENLERAGVKVEDSRIGSSFQTELRETRGGVNQIDF
jgi:hypothetical protein